MEFWSLLNSTSIIVTINESVLSVRLLIFIFKTNSFYIRFGSIWRVGIFCQINKFKNPLMLYKNVMLY
jgi:hypothetical protein